MFVLHDGYDDDEATKSLCCYDMKRRTLLEVGMANITMPDVLHGTGALGFDPRYVLRNTYPMNWVY